MNDAVIVADRRSAHSDSLGRYHLDTLNPGPWHIIVRRIGFSRADTTLTVRAGESIHWNVVLREDDLFRNYDRQMAAAEAKDATTGHIDSIVARLVRPSSRPALPLGMFGSRLFANIVGQLGPDSNTVLSPVSAVLALSLARFGARGATASALDQMLGMGLDQQTIEQRGADMMADLTHRTDVTLEIANAIWLDTAVVLQPEFRASTTRWRSRAAALPLRTQQAMEAINYWADSVTHGKIATILNEPLPDSTRLFIANAVYFKGKWLDAFDKSATRPGEFVLPSGKRITVARMSRLATIGYKRDSGYQTIRLPYRTGKVAMYIVLPDSSVTFDAVLRRLDAGQWTPSQPLIGAQRVHVVLPRFHAEVTSDLAGPLAFLGAGIAFDCDAADFSGMARSRAASKPLALCIGKAMQKAYIDVDEEGTEAAAVTGIGMVIATSMPPRPIEFIVDRPFLFVLRDEMTGADLFVGRIARP